LDFLGHKTGPRIRERIRERGTLPDLLLPGCLSVILSLLAGDSPPDVTSNGHASIGGEGDASCRVKAEDGSPQTDAPFLQHCCVAQGTAPLSTEDVMDQAVMLVHKPGQAYDVSYLSLAKQIGNFGVACGRIGHGVSPFCC
jgi:hypothetical protein